jgi:vitamin B12 transporter
MFHTSFDGRRCGRVFRRIRRAPALLPLASLIAALPPCAAQAQTTVTAATAVTTDTVVITATRLPQALSSVLADLSVIDRDEIERSGATDVAELLARLPGVEFARTGGPGGASSVYVRGGEDRHTALYIDGVRIDSQSIAGATWEQIPLELIERIEVVRGPAAAVYGSDAMAGVVQLFTKRGSGPARPSASISIGSRATAQAQAAVSGSAGAFDYALSAAYGRSDGFDALTAAAGDHNPDRDGWRRHSVQARAGWQLDEAQRVEAALLTSRQSARYDDYLPGADDVNRYQLNNASLSWQARWSAGGRTRLHLGQSETTYESNPNHYSTGTTLRNLLFQHEQTWAGQWLTVTLERREDELFNPATDFSDALAGRRHQDGVGLGWRADIGRHRLQAQVRHDEDSEFGGKTTGSLAWGWTFAPQWRASASAATSFRVPTLYQRFSSYGNAALTPESGRNVELGLRWNSAGDAATQVGLTAWRNTFSHLISFGDPGPCADGFGCYVNVGRARLTGVTVSGRTRLNLWRGVTLRASLDWHDPRNLDGDTLLQRRARRLATLGAETTWAGWTVGADVQAAGRRYEDAANTQAMGGYAVLGVFASTRLTAGLTLEGRIANLADKRYELARTYATEGIDGRLTLRWAMP